MEMQNNVRINRKHKDSSFRYIFNKKENALMLYNAINNSNYQNPDELEMYTMEDFVYMGIKNDLSFLIQDDLNVFEHQSSQNPNMPIRGLLYTSAALKKYIELNTLDIYASSLQRLPVPRYFVLYNGIDQMADHVMLHLTDSMPLAARAQSSVEFTAHLININLGHNQELMERCPVLLEYATFIACIRNYQKSGMTLADAASQAVDDCINQGILANILRGNKAEVTDIMLSEYNEALHIATEKKISYDEGFEAGMKQAAKALIDICQETGLDKPKTLLKLCDGLNIEQSVAQTFLEKFWKS